MKNLFVVAPLVFGKGLGDPTRLGRAWLAFAVFCALSGAVYALNDVVDVEKDRAHPVKKRRPIAAGALPIGLARGFALAFAAFGLVGAAALDYRFAAVAAGYLFLNLAYTFVLKHQPFLDVGSIAVGFLLRVLGGAYAVNLAPSRWLMLNTLLLAAFLGFGKRAHELGQALSTKGSIGTTRRVLSKYKVQHLGWALKVTGVLTSIGYVAYTQAPHTVEFFHTRLFALTAPCCVFGIWRFTTLAMRLDQDDSPTDGMLRDLPFIANLVVWALAVLVIIYVV